MWRGWKALGRVGKKLLKSALLLGALALVSCSDAKEINAAFAQNKVSWFAFDPQAEGGLVPLAGLEQARKVTWVPRNRAVFATDLEPAPAGYGAVAVSRLGLLLLDDFGGSLAAVRPGAALPLLGYQTDRLFTWHDKLFLTLSQEPPAELPPATLAWWSKGQSRLAFYPVPSQVQNSARQATAFVPPAEGTSDLRIVWKFPVDKSWVTASTVLALDTGAETDAGTAPTPAQRPFSPGAAYAALQTKLAERLGDTVAFQGAAGSGPLAVFTDTGWVAVGRAGEGKARLYRLPDLGAAGRYTRALVLGHGYVFSWESAYRGYTGAAGLVYVPFGVLAP